MLKGMFSVRHNLRYIIQVSSQNFNGTICQGELYQRQTIANFDGGVELSSL